MHYINLNDIFKKDVIKSPLNTNCRLWYYTKFIISKSYSEIFSCIFLFD
jgi:hypothetical protein